MTWNNRTRTQRPQPETARQADIKRLVSTLLEHLTPAKHAPPSPKALDVAYRQLMNHSYQTTNEHDVERRFSGLVEKFEMHGQTETADALSDRLDRLAKLSAISVVYDVLHILLETSVSPTHHLYEQTAETPQRHEADLTWSDILAEEPLDGQHWFEDEAEDPGLESEPESDESDLNAAPPPREGLQAWDRQRGPRSLPRAADSFRDRAKETMAFLDAQYWNYGRNDVVQGQLITIDEYENSCDLSGLGDFPALVAHRKFNSSFSYLTLAGDVFVHESDLVRECLYMLAASRRGSSSPAFDVGEDGLVTVNKGQLTLTHLTQPAMWTMLKWFARGGTAVHRVRRFVDTVLAEQSQRTLTEQALANGLLGPIAGLDSEIAKLEEWHQPANLISSSLFGWRLTESGGQDMGTLAALRVSLAPFFSTFTDLQLLLPDPAMSTLHSSPAHIAVKLLSRVHAAVATSNAACLPPERAAVLVDVALAAREPQLEMVHAWIYYGELEDPRDEFFVVRGKTHHVCEEWERGFVIRQDARGSSSGAPLVPGAFSNVKEHILVCGKSLKMIEQIDPAQAMLLKSGSRRPLREALAAEVRAELYSSADTVSTKRFTDESRAALVPDPPDAVAGLNAGGDVARLFPLACATFLSTGSMVPILATKCSSSPQAVTSAVSVRPALTVLRDALARVVRARHDAVAERLTQLLFTRCDAQQHFAALQAVFLMTDGGVMHPFCEELFAMARTGRLASRPHALNAAFADCVAANAAVSRTGHVFGLDASRFSFSATAGVPANHDTNATARRGIASSISIAYDVPPLLVGIITPASIAVYGDIARVLLRLKFVEAELVREARCGGGGGGGAGRQGGKRDGRLRAALRVIHAECAAFAERLKAAKGMDELIALHDAFVSAVRDRCLLSDKARVIWTRMAEVLAVAVRFAELCRARDHNEKNSEDYARAAAKSGDHRHQRVISIADASKNALPLGDAYAFENALLIGDADASENALPIRDTDAFLNALRDLQRQVEEEVALVQKDLEDLARHGVQHLEGLAAALIWV
ncbi:hypothetical protein HDU86_003974 [Geranomyces michiganensis]|nr:hypothetical protein HDU86_003974 [Geranomyces michiganensis]